MGVARRGWSEAAGWPVARWSGCAKTRKICKKSKKSNKLYFGGKCIEKVSERCFDVVFVCFGCHCGAFVVGGGVWWSAKGGALARGELWVRENLSPWRALGARKFEIFKKLYFGGKCIEKVQDRCFVIVLCV